MVAVAGGDTSLCSGAPWPGQQQPAPSGQPCRHPATGPGPTWATELQSYRAAELKCPQTNGGLCHEICQTLCWLQRNPVKNHPRSRLGGAVANTRITEEVKMPPKMSL